MNKYRNKFRVLSARAQWWNYGNDGAYFITVCTAKRKCLFGFIDNKKMILSPLGQIVQQEWDRSFEIRTELFCEEFILMPNHLHAILRIDKQGENNPPVETHGSASLPNDHISRQHGIAYREKKSISSFIAGFKSKATSRINNYRNKPGLSVWQPRFHDHIIRNDIEYQFIARYIRNNPANWDEDTLRK
ncbi:MAG: transposase [Flavobacteriales bacterium]